MLPDLSAVRIRVHLALPSGLTTSTVDASTVGLSWTNNAGAVSTDIWRDNVLIATVVSGVNSYNDGGRSSGIAYGYQLRHINLSTRAYSPRTVIVYGYTALPAPVSLSGSASGQTANLSWTNTIAQQVRVYRGGSLIATVAVGVTTYADNSLADATYSYTVRHYNGVSESADSNTASVTIAAIPPAPTGLAGTPITGTENDLTWTPVDATATAEVYRATTVNPTTLLGTAGANVGAYNDTSAVASTVYHYRVRNLRGGFYSAYSTDISVTTLGPGPSGAPSGLSVTKPFTDRASLAWTNGDALSSTEIWRGGALLTTVAAGTTSYNDDTATQGTAYLFKVRHVRNGQFSAYSNTVSVTMDTPSITGATIVGNVGDDFFTMTWSAGFSPQGVSYAMIWTDANGNFRTIEEAVSSPQVESISTPDAPTGFTITVKNPGVNHLVTITVTFRIKNGAGAVKVTDTTTFVLSVYKPGPS